MTNWDSTETAFCPTCAAQRRIYNGSCLACGAVLTKPEPTEVLAPAAEPASPAKLLPGPPALTLGKLALAVFLGNLMTGALAALVYLALK